MVSLAERERAEKVRSALAASRTNRDLLVPEATLTRYRAPSDTTVFPLEYAFYLLGDVKGKTIVEYGCGDGIHTVALANLGAKVIALDISAQLLALARKRLDVNGCDGVEFLLASAHSLPLPDESVDIIFGMAILHHLDLELASRELRRVLRKGGRAIFKEPVRNSKLIARVRKFFPRRTDASPFERPLTDLELNDFATPCKQRAKMFQLLLSRCVHSLPFRSERAATVSAHVDAYLLRRFPSLTYYGAVKVFELIKEDSN